jgi:hypothetical protein
VETFLDLLQWPAMLATVIAAWLIGSLNKRRRTWGFWCFLLSNVLWVIWGWYASAWDPVGRALISTHALPSGRSKRCADDQRTVH